MPSIDQLVQRFSDDILERKLMLRLATFFLLALLTACLGFGGVARYSWAGAKLLFFIIFVLAAVSCLRVVFYLRRNFS